MIALFAVLALPVYQSYVARARASELALKFDAVRTQMQISAKTREMFRTCDQLVESVTPANLQSSYSNLAVNFETVAGGYAPVLTFCATLASNGQMGVDVTRETHHLLSRDSVISEGALIGESAVSFSVKLTEQLALCKVPPTLATAKAGCTGGAVRPPSVAQVGASALARPASTPASGPVVPMVVAMNAPASFSVLATGTGAVAQKLPSICTAAVPNQISRPVMRFGNKLTGYVMNDANLNTGGDLRSFTAEVSIVGGPQIAADHVHGATLISYASTRDDNEFLLWDPAMLRITFKHQDYNTGININDGENHRVSVTWQSSDGALVLYDNGREVWRQNGINTNGVMRGDGKLLLGQDQDVFGGEFDLEDAYQGTIITASLADRALSARRSPAVRCTPSPHQPAAC